MSTLYSLPEYKQHPVATALMPGGMDATEFDAFCKDVEERGVLFPATIFEGMVLDGWHRYRAAKKTGSELKFVEYKGKDPAGYIASCNVLRRKLSSLQRALVGARLHRDHGCIQREVCTRLGISNEALTLVLRVLDSGSTRLIKRIESDGDFTRNELREELIDGGFMRDKPKMELDPTTLRNSVFDIVKPTAGTAGSTDAEDSFDEDVLDILTSSGAGLKSSKTRERKPKDSPAQTLADGFKALMEGEKITFLEMIWPEAKGLAPKKK